MTFKQDVITVLRDKYFTIDGRAPRSEYWYFWLFFLLVSIALNPIDSILFASSGINPLSALFTLLTFIPFFTLAVRRLHDRDLSGWWLLLMIVPVIGSIALIVIYMMRGTPGPNTFGPDPLDHDLTDWNDDDVSPTSIPRVDRE